MDRRILLIVAAAVLLLGGGAAGYFLRPAGVATELYRGLQDENARLNDTLTALQAEAETLRSQNDQLTQERAQLQEQLAALTEQVDELKSEVSVLRGQNSDLTAQLEAAQVQATMMTQLRNFFSSPSPFEPSPPGTVFRLFEDGSGLFLQFDAEPEQAGQLRYLGTMVPGRFCADETYAALVAQGYVHFRALSAPSEATAAGGRPGEQGYWMRFIALDRLEMPWGTVEPGIDRSYRPTEPPSCEG